MLLVLCSGFAGCTARMSFPCIPRCAPDCHLWLTEKDVHAGWGLCRKCYGHLEQENSHPLLEIFKIQSSCLYPGCFNVPKKNTRMCSGCGQHEDLATLQAWSQEEVDELITERLYFEEFRRTATHSEVYVALKKNYAIAIRNIKQGGTPSMKPKRELSDSDEATGSGTAKMQRTANVSYVLEELQFMSPPQLLKVNKNVAELLEKKFPWFVESKT